MSLVVTESELRACVSLDEEGLGAIEDAFVRYANGEARVPPVVGIEIPEHHGACDVKGAHVLGFPYFAIKISTRYFENPSRFGLSTGSGMMTLVNAENGVPEVLLLDNGYLTHVRTALAGAVVAKHLAKRTPSVVGLVGAGNQARLQAQALQMVRPSQRVLVYSHVPEGTDRCARDMAEVLGCEVVAVRSPEEAVRPADVVITTTPSTTPLVRAEWLRAGAHVTALGADAPHKQELDPMVFERADLVVCDSRAQCAVRGDLHHALESGAVTADSSVELGEVCAGREPGRTSDDQVTVCDLTGVGVQDTAIAVLAFRRASAAGLGTFLE